MWPFNRFRSHRDADLEVDQLLLAAEDVPTKRYVNILLLELHRGTRADVLFREQEPLPRPSNENGIMVPSFASVANRLKVMSNLDPVLFREPKIGVIDLVISNEPCVARVTFNDEAGARSVAIRLERRAS